MARIARNYMSGVSFDLDLNSIKCTCSYENGTILICDQQRLWQACTDLPEPSLFAHTKNGPYKFNLSIYVVCLLCLLHIFKCTIIEANTMNIDQTPLGAVWS